MEEDNDFRENTLIQLDNVTHHKSKMTKKTINQLQINVVYLSSYSPEI